MLSLSRFSLAILPFFCYKTLKKRLLLVFNFSFCSHANALRRLQHHAEQGDN